MKKLNQLAIRWAKNIQNYQSSLKISIFMAANSLLFLGLAISGTIEPSQAFYLSLVFGTLALLHFERSGFVMLLQEHSERVAGNEVNRNPQEIFGDAPRRHDD